MVYTSMFTRRGLLDSGGELRVDMDEKGSGSVDDRMEEDLKSTRVSDEVKKHRWTFGRHRQHREFNWRRIDHVVDGMQVDKEAGWAAGEKGPPEFWRRVWDDMHNGGGGAPHNLPYIVLREKWSAMTQKGMSPDEIWEVLEREYPVPFLMLPLIKRWENLGEGKSMDDIKTHMFTGMEECNQVAIPERLKEKYNLMKDDGNEEEFWQQNWDEVYAMKKFSERCCNDKVSQRSRLGKYSKDNCKDKDMEEFLFPHYVKEMDGELKRVEPLYKQWYPLEYHPKMTRWLRKFRNRHLLSVDERSLYKEFDFIS